MLTNGFWYGYNLSQSYTTFDKGIKKKNVFKCEVWYKPASRARVVQ